MAPENSGVRTENGTSAWLRQQIEADLALHFPKADGEVTLPRLLLACSGGRDSMVALDLLAMLHARGQANVEVFHVHHGLSPHALAWADHVQQVASGHGLACHVVHVDVVDAGRGIEDAARVARYGAMDSYCSEHSVDAIVLAHHANDQAETMLLQLLRGAGVSGLSGMPSWAGNTKPARWRPLLHVASKFIGNYVQERSLSFVEDPSNESRKYARNAIRHDVMPQLEAIRPGAVSAITRSMLHLQEALALEREVVRNALPHVMRNGGLDLTVLKAMTGAMRNAVVRAWVQQRGVDAPSTVLLDEVGRQMFEAQAHAHPEIPHGQYRFVRDADTMYLVERRPGQAGCDAVVWDGRMSWRPVGWSGEFRFRTNSAGVSANMLAGATLCARPREGGESLKIASNRPRRSLKQWYQTLGVPQWRRDSAPLLWLEDRLLYVPYVGMNSTLCRPVSAEPGGESDIDHWSVEWHID